MSITIDFTPTELAMIKTQALAKNTTAEEFIREASAKAARNAEYLAKIDRAAKNLNEGKGRFFTDDDLEELFHGNAV